MCGTWERQRLLSPSTGACHSTPPARCAGAAAGRDVQAIRYGAFLCRGWNRTKEIQKPLVFGGVLFHISFAVERNMAAGGIHAGRGCSPQSENAQRAVGDAGPYAVRHCRAEHGSGSGSCRRVPEPVIARHPRGARERERYENGKRFVVRRSAYILVFAGYRAAFYDAVSRAGSLETCGFKQRFWSLLGLWPKVTRARGRGIFL